VTFVHRLRSLSLTTRCMLATLVVVAGLGVGLSAAVSSVVRAEATAEARRSAEVAASFLQHTLLDSAYARGLTPLDQTRLDVVVAESDLRSLRIWGLEGRVLYDSDNRLEGTRHDVGPLLAQAYAGEVSGDLETVRSTQSPQGVEARLEVYVPLRMGQPPTVVGAVEVHMPYDASAERSGAAARRITELLVCGLAALWGVLWWLSLRVTRALRRSAAAERGLAHTDDLTGLPNRRALLTALDEVFASGTPVALLLLDLDRFKEVNDTLGHHVGDQLLHQVGQRLVATVPAPGTVVRLGGDEFAVLLPGVALAADAVAVSDRLVDVLEQPFALSDLQVGIGTSVGVAIAPKDACRPAELLQRADVAMYVAKERAGGTAVYDSETPRPYPRPPRGMRILVGPAVLVPAWCA
jgi:diguanylate cyclase (GGDEF)-like protein